MKTLHTTKIHDHLQLVNVEQFVNILRFNIDGYQETIELNYSMDFFINDEKVNLTKEPKPWVIGNNQMMMVRDENFQPIPNPDYEPNEEMPNSEDEFLRMPAFDYVMHLMMVLKVDLSTIMDLYILEEARDGRFD